MGCLGVWSGPTKPAPAVLGSDGIGRLGCWTWHVFSDGDSRFIHSTAAADPKKIRHRFCQGFRRWKSKVTSWRRERTNGRTNGTANANSRPTSNQRRSIGFPTARRDECGLVPRSRSRRFRFQMQQSTRFLVESFPVPVWRRRWRLEHVRHLQWSRLARRTAEARASGGRTGCRRRQHREGRGGSRFVRCGFPARGLEREEGESGLGNW